MNHTPIDPAHKALLEQRAKTMRANPTDAERKLWTMLRAHRFAGQKWRRQVIIDDRYIVDFINFDRRLIVEADGSQHADDRADARRDAYLRGQGFHILRFWNRDVLTGGDSVGEAILAFVAPPPLPNPSPARGEGL